MISSHNTILIVDDDEAICELVSEGLNEDGYDYDIALTADEALAKLQRCRFDIALLDINLPGKSGMELLGPFQALSPNTAIVMMTASKDFDTAIQAMKLGASDYITKPFTIDKLCASIGAVLENSKKRDMSMGMNQRTENIRNDMKMTDRSLDAINAIAYGVDAQVDYFDFHSKMVTKKTIDLARQFHLPAKEIKEWAAVRNELYSERNRHIKSMLNLRQNSSLR
jgi:DNA-binding response OmpR family regulator